MVAIELMSKNYHNEQNFESVIDAMPLAKPAWRKF
jgi:hypothetical protein